MRLLRVGAYQARQPVSTAVHALAGGALERTFTDDRVARLPPRAARRPGQGVDVAEALRRKARYGTAARVVTLLRMSA